MSVDNVSGGGTASPIGGAGAGSPEKSFCCLSWEKKRKVEDPARIDDLVKRVRSLSWEAVHQRSSLQSLFECVSNIVSAEITYYYNKRCESRRRSSLIHIFAWILGTIGAVAPLVSPLWPDDMHILSLGYVAVALAGSLMLADNVFGGAQAHQRYVKTQLDLEKIFLVFSFEWQGLMLAFDSSDEAGRSGKSELLIKRAVACVEATHSCLGAETDEWRKAMNEAIAELKRQASAKDGSEKK